MQIGLIGGIGPAATDFYYRRLIRARKKSHPWSKLLFMPIRLRS